MTAVRQLVPKPRSGDIKRSVAQTSSGPRYDACDGPRRAETATGLSSGADLHASKRYDGAQPCSDLNISVVSLKLTRRRTGSQCNSCRTVPTNSETHSG